MKPERSERSRRVASEDRLIKVIRGLVGLAALSLAPMSALPTAVRAQVPPDEAWRTITTDHFRVTFPEGLDWLGRRAGARAERAYGQLSESFIDPPSRRVDLVVTDHTDVSNGYARLIPSNSIVVYARPPIDDLGLGYFDDWLELVVTHELTHIFQLDRAGLAGRVLRSVVGRAGGLWPYFPGAGLPRWTTEGLATWYESRFSHAGRVDGTYHEMVLRTAALEGRFEGLGEASGASPLWPGGLRAYAYGSLFFAYVLDEYGEERMGRFAEAVAGQWVPYRLDAAGKDAFGHTISEEWRRWTEAEAEKAAATVAYAESLGPLTEPERLTRGARQGLRPRVSSDGRWLAYVRSDGRSDTGIELVATDEAAEVEHIRTNGLPAFSWAPDGTLLFAQREYQDPYRTFSDLYRYSPGGGIARVTRGERLTQPSVSPDGTWAVAVGEGGGTNTLVRVDLETGATRRLMDGERNVHWALPAISPDGRWIAVSRWTPGAYTDVLVLDAEGRVAMVVTEDRAVDLAPQWSPDGATLLWMSDRMGVLNVLAATVDPAEGAMGPVRMATNVRTGAGYPSVDPAGAWLYFSGYHVDGWEVERTPYRPETWPLAPAPDSRFDAPSRPKALQDAEVSGPVRKYSPWPTVLPQYWRPVYRDPVRTGAFVSQDLFLRSREVLGASVGVRTSGSGLVGRHGYDGLVRVFPSDGRVDWAAAYRYAGLGNPVLSLGASQFWTDDGVRLGQRSADAPLDTLFALERDSNLSGSVAFSRRRWRSLTTLSLGGGLAWERRTLLDNALAPQQQYGLSRPDDRFADLRLTFTFSTARTHLLQLGAARGTSVFVRGRSKVHLQLPDSLLGRPDSDRSVDELIAQVRSYRALGGPGFAAHVLAFRASVGAARGPGADAGYFDVGGASGSPESVSGFELFGGVPILFPVRGYPTVTRSGRFAWSASAEYRVPIALVNRGLGAWPLHLDRLFGSVFVDGGNAWGPELGFHGFQNPRRSTLASVGAEVSAQFQALWTLPLLVRAGAALPLIDGGGSVAYVRVGLPF